MLVFTAGGRWPAPGPAPYVTAVTSEPGRLGLRTLTLRVDLQIQAFYRYTSANITINQNYSDSIEPETEWVSRDIKKISY